MKLAPIVVLGLLCIASSAAYSADPPKPKDRKTAVLDDRKDVGAIESWVYNDLPKGLAEAKQNGRPMLVVFRCIP